MTPDQKKYGRRLNLDDSPIETLPVQGSVHVRCRRQGGNITAGGRPGRPARRRRSREISDVLAVIRKLTTALSK